MSEFVSNADENNFFYTKQIIYGTEKQTHADATHGHMVQLHAASKF